MISQAFWIVFALCMGVGAAALVSIFIFIWITICAIGSAADDLVKLFTDVQGRGSASSTNNGQ